MTIQAPKTIPDILVFFARLCYAPAQMEVVMLRSQLLALTGCVLLFSASAPTAQEDTVREADRSFPRKVTVRHGDADYDLTVTGTATRKKFIVKVYGIAHYMDVASFASEEEALAAARSGEHPSQITMEFVRDVGAEKIRNAYREGFEKNASAEDFQALSDQVILFLSFFDDVKKNDRFVLQRFPDGTVLTTAAGEEKDVIRDEKFASALWDIWFGDHSPVDRDDLVEMAVSDDDDDD